MEVQENQSGSWVTVAQYDYDAKGRRIVKTVSNSGDLNGTTRYLWGGQSDWQCLEELDGSDNIQARYTYAPGYIDAVACGERDLDGDGDVLSGTVFALTSQQPSGKKQPVGDTDAGPADGHPAGDSRPGQAARADQAAASLDCPSRG